MTTAVYDTRYRALPPPPPCLPTRSPVLLQLGLGHRIHSGSFREVLGMGDRFILEVRTSLARRRRRRPFFVGFRHFRLADAGRYFLSLGSLPIRCLYCVLCSRLAGSRTAVVVVFDIGYGVHIGSFFYWTFK